MKLKKINTILIVFSVAFIAFSIVSAALYFRPSAVRFEIIDRYTYISKDRSWKEYLKHHAFNTYFFDLKVDGTLYIMRGINRKDNDLTKLPFMFFNNRLYIKKLKKHEIEKVIQIATTAIETTESAGITAYGKHTDVFLLFKDTLVSHEYMPAPIIGLETTQFDRAISDLCQIFSDLCPDL